MAKGIYLISDSFSQKVYVGASINLEERLAVHKRRLEQGSHPNKRMQEAFKPEHFSFAILEEVDSEDLIKEREGFYIELFKSYDEELGFNLTAYSGYSARRNRTQSDPLATLELYKEQVELLKMVVTNKIYENESLKKQLSAIRVDNRDLNEKYYDLLNQINTNPFINEALERRRVEQKEKAMKALEDVFN